jgi:hypothetical protein
MALSQFGRQSRQTFRQPQREILEVGRHAGLGRGLKNPV